MLDAAQKQNKVNSISNIIQDEIINQIRDKVEVRKIIQQNINQEEKSAFESEDQEESKQ